MGTVDAQQVAWISAGAALIGALIGSLGGIVAQIVTQMLIEHREAIERARRERRTREAFRGIVRGIRSLADTVTYKDAVIGPDHVRMHEIVIAPLQSALKEPAFYLGLTHDQIMAVFAMQTMGEALAIPLGNVEEYRRSDNPVALEVARKSAVGIGSRLREIRDTAELALTRDSDR